MSELPKISEAEWQVMKIIWQHTPINTNEVIEKLNTTTTWSPKTIQTLLARLVKKGVITFKKESRAFVYYPAVNEHEYLKQESDSFINKFYGGALNTMILNFLQQEKLSKDDIDELKKILAEKDIKGE